MKGTNTIIVNSGQMVAILDKWWSDTSYSHITKDKVKKVVSDDNGNFEITLDEIVEVEKED